MQCSLGYLDSVIKVIASFWGGHSLLLPCWLHCVTIFTWKYTAMSLDAYEESQERRCQDGVSHQVKCILSLGKLTESESEAYSSSVSSCSYNTRDGSGCTWVNVWYNTVRRSLSSLYKGRENDQQSGSVPLTGKPWNRQFFFAWSKIRNRIIFE